MNRFFSLLCLCIFGIASAQQAEYVDFKRISAKIQLRPSNKEVGVFVKYEFEILKDIDSVFLDAVNVSHYEIPYKNFKAWDDFKEKKLILKSRDGGFKANNQYEFEMVWFTYPEKALYFVDWENDGRNQIWTQGQGKYTSNWLPSIDDMNDKIEFDLSIDYDKDYDVVANGELVSVVENDSTKTWQFNMNKPMSSYLVALAIGKYNKKTEISKSGIPLEYYYYPEDSLQVEPTYRYTKQLFDFLEEEIGVPYPWEIYKQVPVKDFLYSGMENTSLTIFSDAFVVDSIGFNDRNYVNVNAHELAHQWFGNLVTETSGTHHWLQEGFATYYALLAERELFGDSYYYWTYYEYIEELLEQQKNGEGTSLLNPKSSSITFYKKGALVLYFLREYVGDKSFKTAIKSYLEKYAYKNVETKNFISEVERVSKKDLSDFVAFWLTSNEFDIQKIIDSYSNDLTNFLRHTVLPECGAERCEDYLLNPDKSEISKVKIIERYPKYINKELFSQGSIQVRQAIAKNMYKVPVSYKSIYESLLKDKSYITIETALYNLWVNFPEDRVKYLQQTKDIYGFNDYNVKLLWLALHLNTIEYQPDKKHAVLDELKGYTSSKYGFELRMNAFSYLKLINGFDEFSLNNLVEATHHHNWRFQQFAKNMLNDLLIDENYKTLIESILNKE